METVEIKIAEYYNKPDYYAYMPESVFNALEAAFIDGRESALVPKSVFDEMMYNFNHKNA